MTRAKRYAQHKGGRKYDRNTGKELPKSAMHSDAMEKQEASDVFRSYWTQCKEHKGYQRLKAAFQDEQKQWKTTQK